MPRHTRTYRRTWLIAAVGVSLFVGQALFGLTANAAPAAQGGVRPRAMGELDCNGWSKIQKPAASHKLLCTDIRGINGHYSRFYDNGHYIGHDEPSIRFLSNQPGSGNNVTFTETLPRDPKAMPGNNHPGHDVTHWFELSVAPWFGMTICDPNSYPQTKCTPNSDNNAPHGTFPGGGAAFMEMQFYPPGFAPFSDSVSCDNDHWCAALNIDSLEATDHSGFRTRTARSQSTSPSSSKTACLPGRPARSCPTGRRSRPTATR